MDEMNQIPEFIKEYLNGEKNTNDTKSFFDNVLQEYVFPEIEKKYPKNIVYIEKFLILFPNFTNPIVKINNEVNFVAEIKLPPNNRSIEKGGVVYLPDIERFNSAKTPEYEGKKVPTIFVYLQGAEYKIFVDFTAIILSEEELKKQEESTSKPYLHYLNYMHEKLTYQQFIDNKKIFYDSGLWPIPRLIPLPLNQITHFLINNEKEKAEKLLIEYCDNDFLNGLFQEWYEYAPFLDRQEAFNEAIDAYNNNKFISVIYLLIPQIEGIITDYLYSLELKKAIPWKESLKINQISDILALSNTGSFLEKIRDKYFYEYLSQGPMLSRFDNWFQELDASIPNRHAIAHGRYNPDYFTKLNCVKLFLIIDTLFFTIKNNDENSKTD